MRCIVEVSAGELLDRLSILRLKVQRLPPALAGDALRSLLAAERAQGKLLPFSPHLAELCERLDRTNRKLWELEDAIRSDELETNQNNTFAELARDIRHSNDQRAALKRAIDELLESEWTDAKSYFLPAI